jgi:arsenate reductase
MAEWVLYFNPRCGSCQKVKDKMEANGIKPTIVEYLKTPPTVEDLEELLKKLGTGPTAITRMKDPLLAKLKVDLDSLSLKAWLTLIVDNPILLERPIVVCGNRAVVARPPERIDLFLTYYSK